MHWFRNPTFCKCLTIVRDEFCNLSSRGAVTVPARCFHLSLTPKVRLIGPVLRPRNKKATRWRAIAAPCDITKGGFRAPQCFQRALLKKKRKRLVYGFIPSRHTLRSRVKTFNSPYFQRCACFYCCSIEKDDPLHANLATCTSFILCFIVSDFPSFAPL